MLFYRKMRNCPKTFGQGCSSTLITPFTVAVINLDTIPLHLNWCDFVVMLVSTLHLFIKKVALTSSRKKTVNHSFQLNVLNQGRCPAKFPFSHWSIFFRSVVNFTSNNGQKWNDTLHPSKGYTMKEKTTLELLPPAGFGIIELDGMVLCFVDKSAQGSRGANWLKSSSSYLVKNAFHV